MNVSTMTITALLLLLAGFLVFRRVGSDYRAHGKLTPFSAFLETLIFFLHALSSYAFLPADFEQVEAQSPFFYAAVACMTIGFILVAASMSRLGLRKSFGREVSGLQRAGLYRFTRNPQIVAYGLVVIGYALLWPVWSGAIWVAVYAAIAHMMVHTEEAHLRQVYGEEYGRYCKEAPRYLGIPK